MKYLFVAIVLFLPLRVMAEWEAPPNPDPDAILDAAREDARAGRYEDALAKHLWFHRHALEHGPRYAGVRLVPALMTWHELGQAYPPALEKLKDTRDEAARHVFDDPDNARQHFIDLRAINRQLREEDLTVAIFVRLDEELPELAKGVYSQAQPVLVKAEEFALCGKYLKSEKAYAEVVELYELELGYLETVERLPDRRELRDMAERRFMDEAATVIALLVINDRKPEAEKIAEDAKKVSKHAARNSVIDAALEGKLPQRKFE